MKNLTSASLTFAGVIGIAGFFFLVQHRGLQSLRAERAGDLARVGIVTETTESSQPPQSSPPATAPATTATPQPPPPTPNGSRLVERMTAALDGKRPALEAAGDTAASALWAERLGILLDLSAEQADSARAFFHQLMIEARAVSVRPDLDQPERQLAFTALEQRLAEYLTTQLGEEKAARFHTAERARREATVEHRAGQALHAVAQVVDLPPDQKDALYAAFAEKARDQTSTFALGQLKPQFAYAFDEGPRVEDPFTLARDVLTPEQVILYEKNRASEAHAQQREMQTALGVMHEVFQQALGQAPGAQ